MPMPELEKFSRSFERTLPQLEKALQAANPLGAVTNAVETIHRMIAWLSRIAKKIPVALQRLFDVLPNLPGFIAEELADLTELIDEQLTGLIDDLASAGVDAIEIALGAVLAFFEFIKKTIYLITDFLRKTFGDNPLIDFIHLQLDLFNNLLGNLMEVISPKFGAKARRLRLDMYGQLGAIRSAQGALAPRRIDEAPEAPE